MQVLLVEDNELIANSLQHIFRQNNLDLKVALTFEDAINCLNSVNFSLILLDVGLRNKSGFDLYQQHIEPKNIPTIFVTAQDDTNSIVKAFNLGAEDYITKPYATAELLARVNRTLTRSSTSDLINIKDIIFDVDKMKVSKNDVEVKLTSLELKIFHILCLNRNKVVTRDVIIEKIWDWTGNDISDNTVSVYLKRIRAKLDTDIIKTVKGIGYLIDE